jgi:NADH:ubiquinone oxidoreductase subunit C
MDIRDKIRERLETKIVAWQETSAKRIYFSIPKEDIFKTVELLFRELGLRFVTASGMQTPTGFEILYHFSDDSTGVIYSVRIRLEDKEHPEVESITPLFPAAEWIEREMWEMLGINFRGHPNLKRLLLAEDWPEDEYPLRQDHES